MATVLEGSVRKEGDRVRITAQLIKVKDGFHLWSESYDRELTDIFAVQEEIARAVAASLKVTLLGEKTATPSSRGTNAEAYNAYLQGRYSWSVAARKTWPGHVATLSRRSHWTAAMPPLGWGWRWSTTVKLFRLCAFRGSLPEGTGGG